MSRRGNGINPDVPAPARAEARPPAPVAVVSCFDQLAAPGRSAADRRQFEGAVLPALWRGIGGAGEPRHERATGDLEAVCDDVEKRLFTNAQWTVGPATKTWLDGVAPPGAKSLIFASYNFPPKCTGVEEKVRDQSGQLIATVDTGKRKCVENGYTMIQIVWTALDGTVLGKVEDRCDNWGESRCGQGYEQADQAVSYLMSFLQKP
ncbi:MAG TPA: hypothetical protein VHO06_07235 [Polyangia bacterium]|nr:hypothetical protein [Polyangia bacterium]